MARKRSVISKKNTAGWINPKVLHCTAFKHNLMPTVRQGGGSVMFWVCFAALGLGQLAIIDFILNLDFTNKFYKIT